MSTTAAPAAGSPIAGSQPFIHGRGDAPAYWWQDILWIILAHGDETGGRWSLMEQLLPRGAGTPPHKHVWSDETFYILDGELTFLVGGEIRTARAGEFVNVPRNTPHGFRVDSGTARFLNGYTPASLEAAVADLAAPTTHRTLPPKGLTSPAMLTPEQFARYGMEMVAGPNPLRP